MTVHRSGPIKPAADDLRIVHRGREVMLKIIDWGNTSPFLAVCELKGTAWAADYIAVTFDDRSDGVPGMQYEKEIAEDGGVIQWIKKRIVPAINATLALMFLPSAEQPPTDPGDLPVTLDGIDRGLQAVIRWAPQPDGTLRVEAV
jgi:hypothetical protein